MERGPVEDLRLCYLSRRMQNTSQMLLETNTPRRMHSRRGGKAEGEVGGVNIWHR